MNELVCVKGNKIFTDTLIIAEGINRKHISVTRHLQRYESDFKDLGKVELGVRPSKSGQKQNVYDLNETQAVFLLTLMDNSLHVIKFKKELSKQFVHMREMLLHRQSSEWLQTRKQGKLVRREEADVIAQLIDYAKNQGSSNAGMFYVNYTKLVNGLVGLQGGQREFATDKTLSVVSFLEDLILNTVRKEMAKGTYYKDIYQLCKQKTNEMMEFIFLPPVLLISETA